MHKYVRVLLGSHDKEGLSRCTPPVLVRIRIMFAQCIKLPPSLAADLLQLQPLAIQSVSADLLLLFKMIVKEYAQLAEGPALAKQQMLRIPSAQLQKLLSRIACLHGSRVGQGNLGQNPAT